MIEQIEAMQILVDACPSFEGLWRAHIDEYGDDLPYVAAGEFARHLLDLHQTGNSTALMAAGVAMERLHNEGTPSVKEFATVGVLEAIQNVWGHSATSPDAFLPYLGPSSQRWWQSLNKFWSGQATHVGADG